MTLQPGCRFVVAPHFHLPADWPRRLQVGTGVHEAEGRFLPLPQWRPPTADELALLTGPSTGPTLPEDPGDCVCLFQLPEHLEAEWWALLEQGAAVLGGGTLPGFESFVSRVGEFLAFKDLPLPEGARCDVVVSDPAQRVIPVGPETNHPVGLPCNLASGISSIQARRASEADATPNCLAGASGLDASSWGGINLGDEETSLVLINLPWRQMDAELHRRFPDLPSAETVGELAWQFLHFCSDYPPVRLILGPGEGYRLPRGGLILDGYLRDKQEPDVLLSISIG